MIELLPAIECSSVGAAVSSLRLCHVLCAIVPCTVLLARMRLPPLSVSVTADLFLISLATAMDMLGCIHPWCKVKRLLFHNMASSCALPRQS